MSLSNLDLYYDTVLNLTKSAGQILRENNSNRDKYIEFKTSPTDLVTKTDTEIENYLISGLSSNFPDHKFIAEESAAKQGETLLTDAPTWIIDPIDGTMNFVHSFPHSCISIALYINKEPAIGIVYNPILEQLFTARSGKGAFLNGKQIRVSNTTSLSKALIIIENYGCAPVHQITPEVVELISSLITGSHSTRALGSAALDLCMVACGGADAFYNYGIKIWDIAAGMLIVREAGGLCTDPRGGPLHSTGNRILAASSQNLVDELSKRLSETEDKLLNK
ncbi:unnamed protein product [Psylliodes chrysocephalus]|uniref:Inositol-1-monophosphatase n=1 Tax=Psylliodes chrysocephalus TaxID=3402493 RepID=A0A9P0GG22_9CUCU|nr:unnamed protein product [Psylliodes chrysocephala]